ncbi:YceI family protein [Granulicella sp. dw_53]|uniref:YceI family protein n=1 Tax=Granulicella sp. dw_53 TaxID=2719792 RepID=UPI001BD427FD|nr:YceI family protein [Granulicella sp. dw_53]
MELRFKLFRAVLLVGGVLLGPLGLHAQEKLVVDPVKSEVHFTLQDVLHIVHGTFHVRQGEVTFNSATGEAGGSIVVDALSGESGSSSRDNRMKKDVLKAQSFATVSFAPTKFTGKFREMGDSTLQVHGVFTLLGTPHEIDVPIEVQVSGNQLHATGAFSVPYVKWGLKDPSTLMLRVNKEVQIDLLLVGTVQH